MVLAAALVVVVAAPACTRQPEVVVFYASSLRHAIDLASQQMQRSHPDSRVRLEPSGSQVAARKVSELGLRADVVAVADAAIIDKMLMPEHASWSIWFATNELVLAHKDHSRLTESITTQNWPQILAHDDVRLGCVDPELAPLGYQTVLSWKLAQSLRTYGDSTHELAERLRAKCARGPIATDETELLSQLESRSVDYAFVYSSTAGDHNLKWVPLPDEMNLSKPELASTYATVTMDLRLTAKKGPERLVGHPIVYGLTIPNSASNRAGAEAFVALLLGDAGAVILKRAGLQPLRPAQCAQQESLPTGLRALVAQPFTQPSR